MSRVLKASMNCALAAAIAATAATSAAAQQQIAVGQMVNGTLTVSDLQWSDGARYDSYMFFGQAGQYVTITMQSSQFDAYLYLLDQNGNQIAYNDDFGGTLNSQIQHTLPFSGTYRIIAKALSRDRYGNYTLSLAGSGAVAMSPQPMPQPMPIVNSVTQLNVLGTIGANQQVQGMLSAADQRWENKPVQLWTFNCASGQTFQMDILSTWDNYAVVYDPAGNAVARDDDTGEGLNARVLHTCTYAGAYRLAVTTYTANTTPGSYTLQVQSAMMAAAPQPMAMAPQPMAQPQPMTPEPMPAPGQTMPAAVPQSMPITGGVPAPGQIGRINPGENVQGRLETGDQQMNDGTWADVWQFNGTAGQSVTIELRSEEFDTYLQLLDAQGNRLAEDDDSLGDLDSRITFTLPAAGMFQIVVNNFSDERRAGIYTLSLR